MRHFLSGTLLLLTLLVPSSAMAQPLKLDDLTPYLQDQSQRHSADIASTVGVGTGIAIDTWNSWDAPNRRRALLTEGIRLGVTVAAGKIVKKLVPRERPCSWFAHSIPEGCGSSGNNNSYFSLHTALAFSTVPHGAGKLGLTFALVGSSEVGALRIAAAKHWLTDVLGGAAVGIATSYIR